MKIVAAILVMVFAFVVARKSFAQEAPAPDKSVYDFTVKDIDGKDVPLSQYKGKTLLIVNTASRCGFTPQYEGLEALYKEYKDKGFEVLAFPANNFMGQEPGSNEEIKSFCSLKFHTTFPLFSKISVAGKDMAPLYVYLTKESPFKGNITWNFNKFLVDKQGRVVARYTSKTKPQDEALVAKLKEIL